MSRRDLVTSSRRWVVKIGSALLTNDGKGLDAQAITEWVAHIAGLSKRGYEVVVVSSGSIAAGMSLLGWNERPTALNELQAAAAVGQSSLIKVYEQAFQKYNIQTAQVLLDHDDLSHRERYLNARSTLRTLTGLNVVPIVNENDTIVTDEIRFGDNDSLGALVANLVDADTLCILTDQDAMYDSDPRKNALAKVLVERSAFDETLDGMAGDSGLLGTGGMASKVRAARLAARSGANTIIVGGRIENVIERVSRGEQLGTLLYSDCEPIAARKHWLAGNMQPQGELVLDDGAIEVLCNEGSSLLAVGVVSVKHEFARGDLVLCIDLQGNQVARGLVNYSSAEINKLKGHSSDKIENILGFKFGDELIHRDDLVLV